MSRRGNYVVEEPYRKVLQTSDSTLALDTDFAELADAIWTNVAGEVSLVMESGQTTVLTLTASSGLNIAFKRVNASGTTITSSALRVFVR